MSTEAIKRAHTVPYKGNILQARPMRFLNYEGIKQAKAAIALIDWELYSDDFPGAVSLDFIGIEFNLNLGSSMPLERLMSMYVDQLATEDEIYIRYADTEFVDLVPANSSRWFPVMTNELRAFVLRRPVDPHDLDSHTMVFFLNFPIIPASATSPGGG